MKKEIKSLVSTAKDIASGYIHTGIILNKDPYRRVGICLPCEFYQKARCKQCGCFVEFKAQFEFAKCPIGKW